MAEINFNPNPINPGTPSENLAGSSAMIVSGIEKELNKIRGSENFNREATFTAELGNLLEGISESSIVKEINTRKDDSERSSKQNKEREIRDMFNNRARARPGGSAVYQGFGFIGGNVPNENPMVIPAGNIDRIGPAPNIDPKLVKEHAVLFARKLTGIPADKMDQINLRIQQIERQFLQAGLAQNIINQLRDYVQRAIIEEVSYLVKSYILDHLSSPQELIDYLIRSQQSQKIINLAFFNDILGRPNALKFNAEDSLEYRILKSATIKNIGTEKIDSLSIIETAKELGVNLDSLVNTWNFDKINISPEGRVTINKALIEIEREKALLLDEYRMLEVEHLLEDDWRNVFFIFLRLRRLVQILKAFGVEEHKIIETKAQARQIAWIKTIANLKELHLKRVLSSSMSEFQSLSRSIRRYTIKARRLGIDISKEGLQWVEARLETLAFEAARYKLELLNSMQELSYDKKREKDIQWLNQTIRDLKERQKQIDMFMHFFEWLNLRIKDFLPRA